MLKPNRSFAILVLSVLLSVTFGVGSAVAQFTTPDFLARYIPAGFVVDVTQSVTQEPNPYGGLSGTKIVARRENKLPASVGSPKSAMFELSYEVVAGPTDKDLAEAMAATYDAMAASLWQQVQADAESITQTQTGSSGVTFLEKETIDNAGGAIYWYKRETMGVMGAGDESHQVHVENATIIKHLDKGVLKIDITDFVGDRDIIRTCFK